jgi:hypothetical protein
MIVTIDKEYDESHDKIKNESIFTTKHVIKRKFMDVFE